MTPRLRILLDQGFPQPPQGLAFEQLDHTVTLEHFSAAFPEHAMVSTADWKMYLLAAAAGFDVVVTNDVSQVDQDLEMVALEAAGVGLVTWNSGEDDPVVLYGQLLAYMGDIVKRVRERRSTLIILPRAKLNSAHFSRPSDYTRKRDQRDGSNWPQRKGAAVRLMRDALEGTADSSLARFLE